MVVLSRQYAEKYMLFLQFSAGGLHDWGILLVIPLEFQEIKHQPFSMTQPYKKAAPQKMADGLFLGVPEGQPLKGSSHEIPRRKAGNMEKRVASLHHAVKINHILMRAPYPPARSIRLRGRPCVRSPFQARGASPLLI